MQCPTLTDILVVKNSIILCNNKVLGFWNSMTSHDHFHDLSDFSMTDVKQLFPKYCQNNLLFKVHVYFPIMMGQMHACVYIFLLELKLVF